jgi:hypothetical protein
MGGGGARRGRSAGEVKGEWLGGMCYRDGFLGIAGVGEWATWGRACQWGVAWQHLDTLGGGY